MNSSSNHHNGVDKNNHHSDNDSFTTDELALFVTAAISVLTVIVIFALEAFQGAPL